MKVENCRTCNARVLWAVTLSGAQMPLDADQVADPTGRDLVLVKREGEQPLAVTYPDVDGLSRLGVAFYRTHFASCKDADLHRKARQ